MEVRLLEMLQQGKPSRSPCIRFEDSSIYLHCTYVCPPGENLHMKKLGMLVGNFESSSWAWRYLFHIPSLATLNETLAVTNVGSFARNL